MEESFNFLPLLLVLFFAFAVPLLVGRMRWLPVVVGEISAGVIIGHSGFNLIEESLLLEILSNMGLAFLMFLAGMEIDFTQILPRPGQRMGETQRRLLTLTPVVYILTLGLALPSGFALNALGLEGNPWLFAFILSATSLGVVLPVLKQREIIHTTGGRAIFYTALLADFLTVIFLTVFIITLQRGLDLEIFSVGLLFVAFFLFYRFALQFFRIPVIRTLIDELSHVTVQIKVRGAIFILMTFVVLAGFLGVELILGAFLAGMIISLLKSPEDIDLVEKLEAFGYGFFIPVFFIVVGINLNLRAVLNSPTILLLLPVLLILSLAVKILPSLLFKRLLTWRETLAGGLLLNTHLSLEIAVAVIGERLGLLAPATSAALILFAVLTVLLMPMLFNLLAPEKPKEDEFYVIIFGAEDLGVRVARTLAGHGQPVRFVEPEPRLVDKARDAGFETIKADTIRDCLEEAASPGLVRSLLILSSDDVRNLLVAHAAQTLGIKPVISLVNDPSRMRDYRSMDVIPFTANLYDAPLLAIMARNLDFFNILTSTTDEFDVREVNLRNPTLEGEALRTLGLPGNLSILAIFRNGDTVVPHGNTRLSVGDRITLFGSLDDLEETSDWMESSSPA